MKVANIILNDLVNGEGVRLSLFVSGCSHKCHGCYNEAAWKFSYGDNYTKDIEEMILAGLAGHDGLSVLGGEPLHPRNLDELTDLLSKVKAKYPEKDIWLWTGFLLEEVADLPIIKYIDCLIDGKYEQDNPTKKPWRGSDNQVLHRLIRK